MGPAVAISRGGGETPRWEQPQLPPGPSIRDAFAWGTFRRRRQAESTVCHVGLVLPLHARDLRAQGFYEPLRENCHPVLPSLSTPDSDLARHEVEIPGAQADTFHQAQAA